MRMIKKRLEPSPTRSKGCTTPGVSQQSDSALLVTVDCIAHEFTQRNFGVAGGSQR